MEYSAKWGVHKYRRRGREVIVHNSRADDGSNGLAQQDNEPAGGEQAESSSSQAPSQSVQSLVVPYTSHSNHAPTPEAPYSLSAEYQQQQEVHMAAQDWEYFHNAWPVQETPMQEDDPDMEDTQP